MVRHMQNVVIYLRNSILQLEGASQFNPKQTLEFKELQTSLESAKKANQRFEESLFLEMGKNQKLSEELERLKGLTKHSTDRETDFQAEKRNWDTEREELLEENKHQHGLIQELKAHVQELKERVKSHQEAGQIPLGEKVALERDLKKAQNDKQVLTECLESAKRDLKEAHLALEKSHGQMPHLQDKLSTMEQTAILLRSTKEDLDRENQELRKALLETKRQMGEREVLFQSGETTIKSLEDRILQLKRELQASPAGEVIRNINASYEAKITFLEKALEEARGRLHEKETLLGQAPAKVENLLHEKAALEQRLIDLEAIVRRVSVNRRKAALEDGANVEFGADECVFFFEFFSLIASRLEKNMELSDLRFKADEALGILLKSHALEPINSLGASFLETHHKPVKAFYTTMLEDGTVIRETVRGFRFRDHVIQRAHVWIVKSRFSCSSCNASGRPQDSFCPKCGLELCAPEGTPKRKLLSMPAEPSICLPLSEFFVKQEHFLKALEIVDYSLKDYPEDYDLKKKRTQIVQHLQEKERY
jgi:hypothetical protein